MPIAGPDHDLRPGVSGIATARLVIVAILCSLQYWFLTSTMEAFQGGDRELPLVATLASGVCFLLGLGLVLAAKRSEVRPHRRHRERGES